MFNDHFRIGLTAGVLLLLQSILAPLVCILSLFVAARLHGVPLTDAYIALAIVSGLLSYIFVRSNLDQDLGAYMSGWTIARQVAVSWIAVVGVLLLLGYATKFSAVYSRRVLFTWFAITPPIMAGTLIFLRQSLRRAVLSKGAARTAVVAGVTAASRQLAESVEARAELGLQFSGFFDDRSEDRLGAVEPGKLLGRLSDLAGYAKANKIDCIFIAIPLSYVERMKTLLSDLQDTTASIYFVPDIFVFDLIQARTSDVAGIPVVALCETPFQATRGLIKRASDVVLASLMLLFALPAMALIALLILLTSPGSVIFKQRRYGLDGEEITIYKFRTMSVSEDDEAVKQAIQDDERVTAVGYYLRKYSLDELPQLINVLQGRMSVVGPRPHAVAHNEQFRRVIGGYMIRHKVSPGITGLAQINGCRGETRSVEDMERRVQYDLEYLRSWSLLLDLKILVKTVLVFFGDDKAY